MTNGIPNPESRIGPAPRAPHPAPRASRPAPRNPQPATRNPRPATRAVLLEVIVASVADAVAAADGGGGRLQRRRALARGGLTPPVELVQQIQRAVTLPLRVMVRESDGFTCASDDERRVLVGQAASFAG